MGQIFKGKNQKKSDKNDIQPQTPVQSGTQKSSKVVMISHEKKKRRKRERILPISELYSDDIVTQGARMITNDVPRNKQALCS